MDGIFMCTHVLCRSIFLIFAFLEVFWVLKIDEDRVLLEIALFENFVDDLFLGERSFAAQDLADHVANDTWLVAPLAERVHTAADEQDMHSP